MLISIIVPVYNTEKFITKCVESIREQSYDKLEIILVDDGSTDNSGVLCDEFSKWDDRIKVIHKANGGSSSARNKGLEIAAGEYIGFVDSDDYLDRDCINLMVEELKRNPSPMVQISRRETGEDGELLEDVCIPPAETVRITATEQLRLLLMHQGDCSFCTRLTARELFDSEMGMTFPEGKLNEDFYLLVKMLASGKVKAYTILPNRGYFVVYRKGSNSRPESSDEFPRVFEDIVVNADMVEELTGDKGELKEEAKRFALVQRLDYMLHIPISQMNRSNRFYMSVVNYIRKNMTAVLFNKYLTGKNRIYLLLLGICPKKSRRMHRYVMNHRKE